MCTVTYLPLDSNNFILTSNRDESPNRKTLAPKNYLENGVEMTFPKDALEGGTWIGVSEKDRLVCLLNGGFESHDRKDTYKMSRGIIVRELLATDDAIAFINDFDFMGIEPFTIVMVDWKVNLRTYEFVWDGNQKHFSELKQEPKIWSSSTLYTQEVKRLREAWFQEWLGMQTDVTQEEILTFHHNSEIGTPDIAVKMKRDRVETVSITSIIKTGASIQFNYEDLNAKTITLNQF